MSKRKHWPDGTKSIMTFRRGTELVPLEALTDEEIQYALPREMRAPTPAQLAALKAYAAKHGLPMEAQARPMPG